MNTNVEKKKFSPIGQAIVINQKLMVNMHAMGEPYMSNILMHESISM